MTEIDHVREQLRAVSEQQRQVRIAMLESLGSVGDLRSRDIELQEKYDDLWNRFNHLRDEAASSGSS